MPTSQTQYLVWSGLGVFVVAAAAIGLLASSFIRVNSDEVGLKYDTVSVTLGTEPVGEGLYTGPPGFEIIKFPSVFRTISFGELICLNKDGVKTELSVSYQYQVRPKSLYDVTLQFRDHQSFETILKAVGRAAIHETCARYNTSQFQSERGGFQAAVRDTVKARYDVFKSDINDLQVNNIKRPRDYETAIKEKEAAKENIRVAENERPQKITRAKTRKREAETQAGIIVAKAYSDSNIIKNKAYTEAAAILDRYEKEAEVYATLVSPTGLNLTAEGFMSYMGVRTVSASKNPVYVSIKGPAKSSYVTP